MFGNKSRAPAGDERRLKELSIERKILERRSGHEVRLRKENRISTIDSTTNYSNFVSLGLAFIYRR